MSGASSDHRYNRPPKDEASETGIPVEGLASADTLPAMLVDDEISGIHWIAASEGGMMPQRVGAVLQFDYPRLAPES